VSSAPPGEVPASAVADSPHPHGDELPTDAPTDAPTAAAPEAPVAVDEADVAPGTEVVEEAQVVPDHDAPGGDELPADAPTFAPADESG
jgi:hypothetical protein